MALEFKNYVHRPLEIEALEITKDNIHDVAEIIGKVVGEGEDAHIRTDERIIRGFRLVKIGWWLTKVGDSYRCYNPKAFTRTFELIEDSEEPTPLVGMSNHPSQFDVV